MDEAEPPTVNGKHHKRRKKDKDKRRTREHHHNSSHPEHDIADAHSPTKKAKRKHREPHGTSHLENHVNGTSTISEPRALHVQTPFHQHTFALYLSLSPIGLSCPLQSLCAEHLSPLLLTYYPPFGGVILSYSNVRLSTSPGDHTSTDGRQKVFARAVNEYSTPFVWLTADFLLLNPQKGDDCEGYIIVQSESNIGLVCWNFFSASIEKERLPKDWTWKSSEKSSKHRKQKLKEPAEDHEGMYLDEQHRYRGNGAGLENKTGEDAGCWVDGNGTRVSGIVNFKVRDVDTSSSTLGEFDYMSILGTMLDEREERQVRAEKAQEEVGRLKTVRIENEQAAKERRKPQHGYSGLAEYKTHENTKHRIRY